MMRKGQRGIKLWLGREEECRHPADIGKCEEADSLPCFSVSVNAKKPTL